jgi:hypothetical protein
MKRDPRILICALALAAAPPARAALGEGVASIEADRQSLAAVRRAPVAAAAYTVHEVVSPANAVREYLSPAGVVFAVAWNGISAPDLGPLLGAYAPTWRAEAARAVRVPGRRFHEIRSDRLVVERWGNMRNMQGRAYDPALLPAGVSLDEIR